MCQFSRENWAFLKISKKKLNNSREKISFGKIENAVCRNRVQKKACAKAKAHKKHVISSRLKEPLLSV